MSIVINAFLQIIAHTLLINFLQLLYGSFMSGGEQNPQKIQD